MRTKDQFLAQCSEELFPELLNRGIQEINSMGLTVYQNQCVHQEELPHPPSATAIQTAGETSCFNYIQKQSRLVRAKVLPVPSAMIKLPATPAA